MVYKDDILLWFYQHLIHNTVVWGSDHCFSILLLSQVLLSDEGQSLLYFPACVLLYCLVQAEGLPFIYDVALWEILNGFLALGLH